VRLLRFCLLVVYSCYLVYAGIALMLLPWSQLWPRLILQLSPGLAAFLGWPMIRGMITAFGLMHLLLLAFELLPLEIRQRFGC